MKKVRILFILCLITALTLSLAIPTGAEPNEITNYTEIYVDTLPVPMAGMPIAPFSFTAEENQFTVTGTWYVYDYQTQTTTAATGTFEDGKLYQLELNAVAAEGWGFHGPYLFIRYPNDMYQSEYSIRGYNETNMTFTISVPCGYMEFIDNVVVIGAPDSITAGEAITTPTLTTKHENAYVTAQWLDADGEPATGTFEDGKIYYLQLTIAPKEGWVLHPWVWVTTIEDKSIGNCETNGTTAVINAKYSLMPQITSIDVTGVVDAVIGQTPTTDGIQIPENVQYTYEDARWMNETTWDDITVFADGNKYSLYIYLCAKDGYEFAHDATVTVNGQKVQYATISDQYVEIQLNYSFLKAIDNVNVTIPAPAVGQQATIDNIVLPEGLTLDTYESYWYEHNPETGENTRIEGAFQKGHKYRLHLSFYIQQGYEIPEDATLAINGTSVDELYDTYCHIWEHGGYLETGYSFMDAINKVEITGVTTPVIGQNATTEGIQITGVGDYTIMWIEANSDNMDPFTGKFELGKAYYLTIQFAAAEGSEFTENCVITINGEETDNGYAYGTEGYVNIRYSFNQKIDKIEITGMPTFTIGGTASVGSLKAPEGAHYTVIGIWEAMGEDYENTYTGTFKADGVYMLVIYAEPNAGYEFTEDAVMLIDGKAPETSMAYVYTEYAAVQYYFVPSYQLHGKVELTIPTPVVGGKPEDHTPKAPENAKYDIEAHWEVSADGKNWNLASGTFQDGKYYRLSMYVYINDDASDTWFGNTPQASVNGVDVVWDQMNNNAGPTYMSILYSTGKLCDHSYGDWASTNSKTHSKTCSKCGDVVTANHDWTSNSDKTCDTCGYNRSDNPATGDAIIPACLLALCSMTALVVLKRRSVK